MSERDQASPDYAKDSPEDEASDAPTGKVDITKADQELAEDQLPLQTDTS